LKPGHSAAFLPYWAQWNYSGYEQTTNPTNGSYVAPCSSPGSAQASVGTVAPADGAAGAVSSSGAGVSTETAGGAGAGSAAAPTTTVPQCRYARTIALSKQFPEYHRLIEALDDLPPGRALWEGGASLDRYGTPLALMLLPYWTHGRIASMEGVYFEASA